MVVWKMVLVLCDLLWVFWVVFYGVLFILIFDEMSYWDLNFFEEFGVCGFWNLDFFFLVLFLFNVGVVIFDRLMGLVFDSCCCLIKVVE